MENNIDTIVPFILEPDYRVIIYNTYSNIYEFKEKNIMLIHLFIILSQLWKNKNIKIKTIKI